MEGANVTLITGPTHIERPRGVKIIDVTSAREMMSAVEQTVPMDVMISVAAVADWHVKNEGTQKIKKQNGEMPNLNFSENPDILKTISHHENRPELVIGFAAETEKVIEHARTKLKNKGCDWILANDVSGDVMGGDQNQIHFIRENEVDSWPAMDKKSVAENLTHNIIDFFKE